MVFTSMIAGPAVGTALGADNGWHQPPQNRAAYQRDQYGNRGRYDNRGRHDDRRWHDNGGWRDSRGWHPYQPVYAPPPVVYGPAPSPGISVFFPFFH